MKKQHCYDYPKADHTVDAVVFSVASGEDGLDAALEVLLIQRKAAPHRGAWALPGGFIEIKEDLEDAVRRELKEETGLRVSVLEQLSTFGKPGRDPRGRVISTAFMALVDKNEQSAAAGSDAAAFQWTPVATVLSGELPVAFDHREIVTVGVRCLRSNLRRQPVGIELLPEEFSLTMLQRVYEVILDRTLDKRKFRKKVVAFGVLAPTRRLTAGRLRPVQMYRFDRAAYHALNARGVDFEI